VTTLRSVLTYDPQVLGGYILGGFMLLSALILGLTYTFSQDNPNANVTLFVLTFPAKYLPYVMAFITLVSAGPRQAQIQLSGLLAAHLYDFLTRIWPTFGGGREWITTPLVVKRWFNPDSSDVQTRVYGTAIQPRQNVPRDNAWSNQRGPGRRLGGD
jgi:Derlin-2/3